MCYKAVKCKALGVMCQLLSVMSSVMCKFDKPYLGGGGNLSFLTIVSLIGFPK